MRLIHARTFELKEFFDEDIPEYAILSHTWGEEEISFAEFKISFAKQKKGYSKITFICNQALTDSLQYAWVDSCCIDKSSSAELSEAINSMYKWYKMSIHCYAYLSDVAVSDFEKQLPKSRWFRRGWTLQELIAPKSVKFFDQDWQLFGTKAELTEKISQITGIDESLLGNPNSIGLFSVAQRMSWASNRETTRVEDAAYALMGIFGVNMPLLYGEGKSAFIRLQEEIIRISSDDSIFAWEFTAEDEDSFGLSAKFATDLEDIVPSDILAESPSQFKYCGDIKQGRQQSWTHHAFTNHGFEIQLPVVYLSSLRHGPSTWIGFLNCQTATTQNLVGLVLVVFQASLDLFCRVRSFKIPTATTLFNARIAAEANIKKITIVRNADTKVNQSVSSTNDGKGVSHVIISEHSFFGDHGYYVSSVTSIPRFAERQKQFHWNPVSKILSTSERCSWDDIWKLTLTSSFHYPEFSIVIWALHDVQDHLRAVIWKGSSFSDVNFERLWNCPLQKRSQEDLQDLQDNLIVSDQGETFRVILEVNVKRIINHEICNIFVGVQ
jgi:hypothetical protein